MKSKLIPTLLLSLFITGCGEPRKYNYVVTEKGLVAYSQAYCTLGMLVNNAHINIRDENDKPITCSGMVRLTEEEASRWEQQK